MKHWSVKLIALILVAVCAFSLAVCGISIIYNVNRDMYGDVDLATRQEELMADNLEYYQNKAAYAIAVSYLRGENTAPDTTARGLWNDYFTGYAADEYVWPECEYRLCTSSGTLLSSTAKKDTDYLDTTITQVSVPDGTIVRLGLSKEFPDFEELPVDYEWTDRNGNALPDLDERTVHYDIVQVGQAMFRVETFEPTTFRVEILLTESDMGVIKSEVDEMALMEVAYQMREFDIPGAIGSAIVLVVCMLYLCCVSGKKPGGEIAPRGLNLLPLDLYACAAVCGGVLGIGGGVSCINRLAWGSCYEEVLLYLALFGGCAVGMALFVTLFLMALCAQVRMGGGAWYKRSLLGRCGRGIWNFCGKVLRWAWNLTKKVWNWLCEKANMNVLLRNFFTILKKLWGMMDLVWQWVALYGALFVATVFVAKTFRYHDGFTFLLVGVCGFVLVVYTGFAFGRLRDAAKRMSEGDLDSKIKTYDEFLYGHFAEFAEDLNTLSDTCVDAAMAKMKSERMKTELITNVSHDIKTPLTSIINYVDLLKQAENEEQRQEYLEVLDRQSQRLKKLIEDLMEMSKASTGNVNVELTQTDVVEAVNQALGEFSDRFDQLGLNIVFRQKDQSIQASCDGKLLWRVLSNLLVNVVKYALPNTRVYVDVTADGHKVLISLKNISREPLNIPAEELMERFVRGDESRTDQGNGLGLNIAKSLMEVQHGDLDLTVDGDLFKVTLTLNQ